MIDAIIIDDEKNAVITLANDLAMYCPNVNVSMRFTKPAEALHWLKDHQVEIIFLDINMPVMNGFDFLKAIGENAPHIIFISAHNEFAVRAFKVSALDYLLKPIDPAELQAAVQKAIDKTQTAAGDQELLFRNFMLNYSAEGPKGKIALPVADGYHLIDPAEIMYCRAKGAYTEIITVGGKNFLISRSLGRIQELMPESIFERIHQSYLVNLNFIKKFRKGESPIVVMSNEDALKVSRMNKDRLSGRLGIS